MKVLKTYVLWLLTLPLAAQIPFNVMNPGGNLFSSGNLQFNAVNINLTNPGYKITGAAKVTLKAKDEIIAKNGFEATNLSLSGEAHLMIDQSITSGGGLLNNDFKIGIFSLGFDLINEETNKPPCNDPSIVAIPNSIIEPFGTTPFNANSKTSAMNVLSEDGFNIMQSGYGYYWYNKNQIEGTLKLSRNNKLQLLQANKDYFQPDELVGNPISGTNMYNSCGLVLSNCAPYWASQRYTPNYDDLFNTIYTQPNNKDAIWGYQLTEEASFGHPYFWHSFTPNTGPNGNDHSSCVGNSVGAQGCGLNAQNQTILNAICDDVKLTEVPPANVWSAINHFNSMSSNTGHKMVIMEANHGKNTTLITQDQEGVFNPQDYIALTAGQNADVAYFEGSYFKIGVQSLDPSVQPYSIMSDANAITTGQNFHYLGKFKSIDFAKGFTDEIHSVIDIDEGNGGRIFNPLSNARNADWLWFQAYNSIIHGAKGIWFWGFNSSYDKHNPSDVLRKAERDNKTSGNRFERYNFPIVYQDFVSNLSKELRYLVNNNILSNDPSTVWDTKTDHSDQNGIIPPAHTYINSLNTGLATFNSGSFMSEYATENYGLRYTIRTQGTEVYMIITNPLNAPLFNVKLNFAGGRPRGSSVPSLISGVIGAEVLFDSGSQAVTSNTYKVNRNSNINLSNNVVGAGSSHNINVVNGQLPLSFGPLDVKVLKFVYNERSTGGTRIVRGRSQKNDSIYETTKYGSLDELNAINSDNLSKGNFEKYTNDNINLSQFEIFPNPAESEVKILLGQTSTPITISVLNVQGKEVLTLKNQTESTIKMDVSSFKKGIYLVKINNGKSTLTKKLAIQ